MCLHYAYMTMSSSKAANRTRSLLGSREGSRIAPRLLGRTILAGVAVALIATAALISALG
jgi:hypothetical protein